MRARIRQLALDQVRQAIAFTQTEIHFSFIFRSNVMQVNSSASRILLPLRIFKQVTRH